MIAISPKTLLFLLLLGFFGYAIGGNTPTKDEASSEDDTLTGNIEAGEARYKKYSSLMIMMAKPLTDEEIADLAAYLKDAKQ